MTARAAAFRRSIRIRYSLVLESIDPDAHSGAARRLNEIMNEAGQTITAFRSVD